MKLNLYFSMKKPSFILLIVVILIFSMVSTSLAVDYKGKEEVVYAMLDTNGEIDGVYVVNIFDQKGKIVDYGDYSSIRNMTSKEKINMEDNKITVLNNNKKLYYEGKLKRNTLPWNISIKYYLDGKEYTAEKLAGKSGYLKIDMVIRQNKEFNKIFYENYALQTELTLDTSKYSNIEAKGATIANIGKDKKLTYTILPGQGADISVAADVTDFEMYAININGIQLNINTDIDDSEIMDNINELTEAIEKLNNGADHLRDGSSDVNDGTDKLESATKDLKKGSYDLDNGVNSLKNGIIQVQGGLNKLNDKSSSLVKGSEQVKYALLDIQEKLSKVSTSTEDIEDLINASSSIKKGINDINSGIQSLKSGVNYNQYKGVMKSNGLNIDVLKSSNTETINKLNTQIESLRKSYNNIKVNPEYGEQAKQLKNQIDQLTNIVNLLNGNNSAIYGTENYLNGVSESISEISDGSKILKSQYEEFDGAIIELSHRLNSMLVDMTKLSDGIDTLVEKYTVLDSGINEYTNGLSEIVNGYSEIVKGVNRLSSGSRDLTNGTNKFYDKTRDLMNGVNDVYNGTVELSKGTNELKEETSNMDNEVNDQIDNIQSKITSNKSKTTSFVSKKNDNIKSVQFVIKTEPIKIEEIDKADEEPKETLNFWEKLLKLFGFN